LIILLPAIVVALRDIIVFRYMGVRSGYGRLAGAMTVFFAGI
jgi:hypothetical protein